VAGHPDQLLPIVHGMRQWALSDREPDGDPGDRPTRRMSGTVKMASLPVKERGMANSNLHDATAAPRREPERGTAAKPATCGIPAGPT